MSRKIRILGIQSSPESGNKEGNLRRIEYLIGQNSWFNPDLIVLPEVFNSGAGFVQMQALSEFIPDGLTTEFISSLAEKYSTNIVSGSYIEKCPDGKLRNASVVFNREGKIIGKYHKIHMFSYFGSKEGEIISAGESICVVETDIGKIGMSICYDLRFPELYRALNDSGAEIIVCPAAWPYPRLEHWLTLTRARAIENQLFLIAVNQGGKHSENRINAGHSMIISPWVDALSSTGDYEGIIMAEIDLDNLKKLREEFPVLKDRKPEAYQLLN